MRFDSENRWESQAITFNCVFPLHGVFSCDFLICVHVRCVFLFFFCDVHVWTCVVSVVQWSSWVFMCGVCFSIIFLCVHVGRVFSVTFTCVHVWCVLFNDFLVCSCVACFSVVFRKQKRQIILSRGGGQICYKYVPSTCYIFLPSPPQKKTNDSSEGRVKFVTNTSPALVTFFTPPRYKNLTKIMLYL